MVQALFALQCLAEVRSCSFNALTGVVPGSNDGATYYARGWPDLLLFYGFIYVATLPALICRGSPKLRRFMSWRPTCFGRGMSLGWLLMSLLTVLLLFSLAVYWFFYHGWGGRKKSDMTVVERLARTSGQVSVCSSCLAPPSLWVIQLLLLSRVCDRP